MNLKSVKPHVAFDQYSNILENNLVHYYTWQFLKMGGWIEIEIDDNNYAGDNISRLRSVTDPLYIDGQIWEGIRKDWVWETGILYEDYTGGIHDPLPVSGLTVDNVSVTGNYIINYPQGRIIFNSPINTESVVKLQYSYKTIQVISTNSNLWNQIQQDTEAFNDQFLSEGSGDWDILSQHRTQLPLVAIEVDAVGRSSGFEVGNRALQVDRDVLFFILTENKPQRNNLMDILSVQNDEYIWLFDTNEVALSGGFALDYDGSKVRNAIYPELVSETGYRWKKTRMSSAEIINIGQIHNNLYQAVVKTTFTSVL